MRAAARRAVTAVPSFLLLKKRCLCYDTGMIIKKYDAVCDERYLTAYGLDPEKTLFFDDVYNFSGGMMTTGISQLQYPHKTEPRA